ncbi:hypothetical protein, partial [Salmonella sp. SAL4432]|uniref:hypothetical protein n=1 Tax=Salmonella sp. SAL4432 TaxID=3159887 RepID=UPI003979CF8C
MVIGVPFVFLRVDVYASTWSYRTLPFGWAVPPFRYTDVIPPRGPTKGWYNLLALAYLSVSAGNVEELYYRGAMN